MKGLILCAGNATRIQPFSFSIPKALLPVANQTVLDRCIRNLAEAGINDIGVVINPQQSQIERHIRTYVNQLKMTIIYQTEQLGIAHALICTKSFIDQEPFVLLLGDNLILEPIQTLLNAFQNNKCAIMLASVESPSDYGIAELRGERVIGLEEKPREPKSPYAVIGAYAFQSDIFEAATHITPSERGEYEITDCIDWLIQRGNRVAYSITDKLFYDIGTPQRWLEANRLLLQEEIGDDERIGNNTVLENCTLRGPVIIGNNCRLKNVVIGPNVSIQDGCILTNCTIEDSICMEESTVAGLKLKISDSIVGRGVRLEDRSGESNHQKTISCILGDKSVLVWK